MVKGGERGGKGEAIHPDGTAHEKKDTVKVKSFTFDSVLWW